MGRALELASRERPHPNPRVGAVLIDGVGRVVAGGAHRAVGEPHAEVVVLSGLDEIDENATLVVTLEPCDHHGRTGPCTEAIINAGIKRVVIGARDPDARVAGSGIARLRGAGIEVIEYDNPEHVESIDPAYFHHRRTGRARLTLKAALTLDGQMAAADGTSRWITGEEARRDAHQLRSEADAIVVGSGTVIADDPLLDVRLPGYDGPQPRPVVVLGLRPIAATAQVMRRDALFYGAHGTHPDEITLDSGGKVNLSAMAVDLGDRGLLEVMVEGGPTLAAALFEQDLVDRGVFYLAGRIAGGVGRGVFERVFATLEDSVEVHLSDVRRLGSDLRVEWSRRR